MKTNLLRTRPLGHRCIAIVALAVVGTLGCFVPSAQGQSNLFALVDSGELYASNDGGANWSIRSTLPVRDAVALAARLTAQDMFLASESGTIYHSADAGMTWSAVGSLPGTDVVDLAIRPDGAVLILTRTGIVWISTDAGASFTPLATMTASNHVSVAMRAAANDLFAITETGEVARSTDDGQTWATVGAIPTSLARRVRCLGNDVFVLTGAGTTYKSMDDGVSWAAVGTLSQVGTTGLTSWNGALAAATKEGLVATSPDGSTWTWVGSVNQVRVATLANDIAQAVDVLDDTGLGRQLSAPWPNPLRAGAELSVLFRASSETEVTFELFDARGRLVAQSEPEKIPGRGLHRVHWTPRITTSGMYFHRVTSSAGQRTSRLTVIR